MIHQLARIGPHEHIENIHKKSALVAQSFRLSRQRLMGKIVFVCFSTYRTESLTKLNVNQFIEHLPSFCGRPKHSSHERELIQNIYSNRW